VRQFGSLLNIADILERELNPVIHDWLSLVEKQENPMSIKLSYEDRTGHLPVLLREVIARLEVFNATHDLPNVLFCIALTAPEPETIPLLVCTAPLPWKRLETTYRYDCVSST
jgi:hypothetical protein